MNFAKKKKSFLTGRATTELRKLDIESQRKVINYLLKKIDISTLSNEARSFVGKLSKNTFGQYDYISTLQQTPSPQKYAELKVEPINRGFEETKNTTNTMPPIEDFDKMEAVEQEEIELMKKKLFSVKVISMLNNIGSCFSESPKNIINYLIWKKKPKGDPPALTEDESFFVEGLIERPGGQYDYEVSGVMNLKTKAMIIEQKSKKKDDWRDFVSDEVAGAIMEIPEDSREMICNFILWKKGIKKEHSKILEDELRFFNSLIKNANGQYCFPPKNGVMEVPLEPKEKGKTYKYKDKEGKIYSVVVTKKDLKEIAEQIAKHMKIEDTETEKRTCFDEAKGFVMVPYFSKKIEEDNKEMDESDVRLFAAEIMVDILKRD